MIQTTSQVPGEVFGTDADMRRMDVFAHLVNRADSGSPNWIPVYYADKSEAEQHPKREETLHEEPTAVAAWYNIQTAEYFDWKDKTKKLEVITSI